MISDVRLISFDENAKSPSFCSSLTTILFYKKSLKPVKIGFEWASHLQLDAQALERLAAGQTKMDSIITPFIFPSLLLRSAKLYQHVGALFEGTSKKSTVEQVRNVVHDVTTATGQVAKATLLINKGLSDQWTAGLSYSSLNVIGYIGCITSLLSDLLQLGKDIKKYYNLTLIKSQSLEDEQRLENKKKYRALRIAQDVGNLALSILMTVGLLFRVLFSSFMVLAIATAVLCVSMAKFFFFEDKLIDKLSESPVFTLSGDPVVRQKRFSWEETKTSISSQSLIFG